MTYKPLPWAKEPHPDFVSQVTSEETETAFARFRQVVEPRRSAIDVNGVREPRCVYMPTMCERTLVLPGGILAEEFEREDDVLKIDEYLNSLYSDGFLFWGIGFEVHGALQSSMSLELRKWMKSDLLLSPTCLMSKSGDFVLISDEQLRFSVAGGPRAVLDHLDDLLGGAAQRAQLMKEYVEAYGIGFGEPDREWARANLLGGVRLNAA